jgi:hypothetical protein
VPATLEWRKYATAQNNQAAVSAAISKWRGQGVHSRFLSFFISVPPVFTDLNYLETY